MKALELDEQLVEVHESLAAVKAYLEWDWEGSKIAEWYANMGIAAFVLKYRLPRWETSDCKDKVAIVVYAGAAGVVLEPTSGDQLRQIHTAIDKLNAGGSTAGGEGIELAYALAQEHFSVGGNNRVILATDGDFNV